MCSAHLTTLLLSDLHSSSVLQLTNSAQNTTEPEGSDMNGSKRLSRTGSVLPRVEVFLDAYDSVCIFTAGTTGRRALRQQTDPLAAYAAVDCNVSISVSLDSFSTGLGASMSTGAAALGTALAGLGIEVSATTLVGSTRTVLSQEGNILKRYSCVVADGHTTLELTYQPSKGSQTRILGRHGSGFCGDTPSALTSLTTLETTKLLCG